MSAPTATGCTLPGLCTETPCPLTASRISKSTRPTSWQPARLVVIEFPSMDDLHAWYRSPEYQAIVRAGASARAQRRVRGRPCALSRSTSDRKEAKCTGGGGCCSAARPMRDCGRFVRRSPPPSM
ncbi:DUF1330 domain-containing protein [Variovorax guangxiensis]|uniref:DUF1330 domain-containing protein n=1 Tax=Variovorax guangxiensis TaxID=1775474 RepID=UPI00286CC49B|nr:DUF1330 domain-containing protein [Variovorax guangxiensis]